MSKKLKIAFTFADASSSLHVGGEVERFTVVSEIDMPAEYDKYLLLKDKSAVSVSLSFVCDYESEAKNGNIE